VLRRIFEPGGWRELYIEELHNLNTSSSIMRMNKSKRMKNKLT
jgi:hypothetical protein